MSEQAHEARVKILESKLEQKTTLLVAPSEAALAQAASKPQRIAALSTTEDARGGSIKVAAAKETGPKELIINVTTPQSAMIIGKKGAMLKLIITKSQAKITLAQHPGPDGLKRLAIEGEARHVDKAAKMIADIVKECDNSKYEESAKRKEEEATRLRQEEEEKRKAAGEAKDEHARAMRAEKEWRRREKEEEAARVARKAMEEKRWAERQEKAAAEANAKKKLQAKLETNRFQFLDSESESGDDSSDEEEESAPQPAPSASGSGKKKKKKKKSKSKAAAASAPAGDAQASSSKAAAAESEAEDSDDDDDDDDEGAEMIGLDRMMSLHAELGSVESGMQFKGMARSPSNARLNTSGLNASGLSTSKSVDQEEEESEEEEELPFVKADVGTITRR
jgi:hypothetical protein